MRFGDLIQKNWTLPELALSFADLITPEIRNALDLINHPDSFSIKRGENPGQRSCLTFRQGEKDLFLNVDESNDNKLQFSGELYLYGQEPTHLYGEMESRLLVWKAQKKLKSELRRQGAKLLSHVLETLRQNGDLRRISSDALGFPHIDIYPMDGAFGGIKPHMKASIDSSVSITEDAQARICKIHPFLLHAETSVATVLHPPVDYRLKSLASKWSAVARVKGNEAHYIYAALR
ncbi:MAG: hypothetical protein GYA55_08030 [SAR324 cluster bacterium]|uniref:Uncharacterized protein n=1 Tax=SAR324 cluster bacterium TaxID=2024889 RepID=A0A7X9IKE5_9DELT|nr:hypothetical protein [SAR324 cluster bacterium]